MAKIHVKVETFEGPLDLLLHLIEAAQVEITDIPLAEIAQQYLEAVAMMQEMEIEVASEYLVVAAQLLAIKSRKLLPPAPSPAEEEPEGGEDLQQLLMERLLEYRRFKNAAAELKRREQRQSRLYTREPHPQWLAEEPSLEQLPLSHTVEDLRSAFCRVLQREPPAPPPTPSFFHRRRVTVQEKLQRIVRRLKRHESVTFWQLVDERKRQEIVVTFLALLELLKMSRIRMYQAALFADITIVRRAVDGRQQGAS